MMKKTKFLVTFLIFMLFIVSTFAYGTNNVILNNNVCIQPVLLNNEGSLKFLDILVMNKEKEKDIIIRDYNIFPQKDYKQELDKIKDNYFRENYHWYYLKNGKSLFNQLRAVNVDAETSQNNNIMDMKFFKNDYSKVIKKVFLNDYDYKSIFNLNIFSFNNFLPKIIEIKPNIFIFS